MDEKFERPTGEKRKCKVNKVFGRWKKHQSKKMPLKEVYILTYTREKDETGSRKGQIILKFQ